MNLEILYQDDYLVAINKPTGLLVHRSKIAADAEVFALQTLRDQIDRKVFPIHRLDRKTSGVLLFALDSATTAAMQDLFTTQSITKEYHAIVRGYLENDIMLDHPLTNLNGVKQEAITAFTLWQRAEIDIPFGKFETSRYSLIKAYPKTGRMHQIRKHLNHLRHPIIGDRPHGCNKQNKLFLEKFGLQEMLLHSRYLSFRHPYSDIDINIVAPYFETFRYIAEQLQFSLD